MTCGRIIAALPRVLGALTLEIWRSRNNAEEPRFGEALPRLRAFSLEGDRPRELDIREPASQAMSEGALRSFYRRTTALGDSGRYYLLAADCPGQAVAIGSAGLAVILRFAQWW